MSGFIMNNSSRCFEIEEIPYGIDIDTKTDFDVAELIFQKYKKLYIKISLRHYFINVLFKI